MLMATKTRSWSARDLDRLPDDGNRYEVVDGELFVTPSPSLDHQFVSSAINRRLLEFVRQHALGWVFYAPGDVHIDRKNRVQPDIFVVPRTGVGRPKSWRAAPKPILVAEILSGSTAHRDHGAKRKLYERERIPEYWIVDHADRTVHVVQPGMPDITVQDRLEWRPAGAAESLVIDLPSPFREALDE